MPERLPRRTVLASALLLAVGRGFAAAAPAAPSRQDVSFTVWRNGARIGRHDLRFEGGDAAFQVAIEAEMRVTFGPVPVFDYHHQALEDWRDGRFATLQSHTTTNGRRQSVSATRTAGGVAVSSGDGRAPVELPAASNPLTHWNPAVLDGPLFNPQTGAPMREHLVRSAAEPLLLADGRSLLATRYALTGTADIVDWYDAAGTWVALKARAPDGSTIDYRLV